MKLKCLWYLTAALLAVINPAAWGQTNLMSLDEAINAAATEIEAKLAQGTEIAVYKITASHDAIGDFLADSLNNRIAANKKLVPLSRKTALSYVNNEQQSRLSDLVSDASAVDIGRYLGAKAVISGSFDRYADFSQLRLRAVDARTSVLSVAYTVRIRNNDTALARITAPLGSAPVVKVSENALNALNRGKDLHTEGKLDEAIKEYDRALAIDANLEYAYFYRGLAYQIKGDYEKAIADLTQAIRLNPNYGIAYGIRGNAYNGKGDYDRAIADFIQAIRLNPNDSLAYNNRGVSYFNKKDYEKAIADYTQVIRLNLNDPLAYNNRGNAYGNRGDIEKAMADYNQAIQLNPNYAEAYYNRGNTYRDNGDYDRAIADFNQAIRLNPNYSFAYNNRPLRPPAGTTGISFSIA